LIFHLRTKSITFPVVIAVKQFLVQ